ncbi:kinase-like protein [Trametes elegans]|nr:kinase-like protein [Trametes elegans]
MVVKFGFSVHSSEADAMIYVASRTTIPVPQVYAVFAETHEDGRHMTYIVQEHIPGVRLDDALQSLRPHELQAIARQMRDTLAQLSALSTKRTRLQPFSGGSWAPTVWFQAFQDTFPMGDEDARVTESFLAYFRNMRSSRYHTTTVGNWPLEEFLGFFDLTRAPIFSHGDLSPCNLIVDNGRISGIVDWAGAGWYPYFWDSFVLGRSIAQLNDPEFMKLVDYIVGGHFPEAVNFEIVWEYEHGATLNTL